MAHQREPIGVHPCATPIEGVPATIGSAEPPIEGGGTNPSPGGTSRSKRDGEPTAEPDS